jgi:hypothetical protein
MTTDTAITELLSAYKVLIGTLDLALLPSGVIALSAIQQYRASKPNYRLDLYSRRYAVFEQFLAFTKVTCELSWQELVDYEHNQGSGKIRDTYAKVMTAREEGEFFIRPQ